MIISKIFQRGGGLGRVEGEVVGEEGRMEGEVVGEEGRRRW